jgi:hypothetical protein
MKVVKSSVMSGDVHDKSLYMKVSEREYAVLISLIGYTTGEGNLDQLTLQMYQVMKHHGKTQSIVTGHDIKLDETKWPNFEVHQHENN